MEKNEENLLQGLQNARVNGGTVTYHFADNTKQKANINKEVFYNEKGRERDLYTVLNVFRDTMHDLKATSFEF